MKNYLMVYSDTLGNRDFVNAILNRIDCDWRYDIDNCYYLKSELSADEITQNILRYARGRFLITEISSNRQGILPKRTWEFLKK